MARSRVSLFAVALAACAALLASAIWLGHSQHEACPVPSGRSVEALFAPCLVANEPATTVARGHSPTAEF
jgi:hypothetical protein